MHKHRNPDFFFVQIIKKQNLAFHINLENLHVSLINSYNIHQQSFLLLEINPNYLDMIDFPTIATNKNPPPSNRLSKRQYVGFLVHLKNSCYTFNPTILPLP